MLTDIEIAKSVKLRPINEVAAELGIHEDQVENYGRYIAKITTDKIDTNKFKKHHLHCYQPYQGRQWQDHRICRSRPRYAEDWQEGCRCPA